MSTGNRQEPHERVLLLCANDPALGGVLVRGPRALVAFEESGA